MTRVKICGLTNPADRDAAIAAGAHALGFTVSVDVDTPREIAPGTAAALIDEVPPFVTTVLVTMPQTANEALALLEETRADAIQVHGQFTPETLRRIAEGPGRLIAAVDVSDSDRAMAYDDIVDALLVDSTRAEGAGGTGETHDWTATRSLRETTRSPLILAGGLTPSNVTEAIQTVTPYAVDVASGTEVTGGQKDHDAIREFIATATQAPEAPAT